MSQLLSYAVTTFWPSRSEQELWLDLGERKCWTPADLRNACRECTAWLQVQNLCPPEKPGEQTQTETSWPDPKTLRDQAQWLFTEEPNGRSDGVANANHRLAPLLGLTSAGTFANTLSRGFQPKRLDHLWMQAMASPTSIQTDQILFHERSQTSLDRFWRELPGVIQVGPTLEARLILGSLLALYQRRKSTKKVKANRETAKPRRVTPKPAARLPGILIKPLQARNLLTSCSMQADDPRAQTIGRLVMEATLTRAHLEAHPSRSTETLKQCFPVWVSECLGLAKPSLQGDFQVWQFRVDRMRAYQAGDITVPPMPANPHPYVEASVHLAWLYANRHERATSEHTERLNRLVQMRDDDLPGLVMQGSQIRRWDEKLQVRQ